MSTEQMSELERLRNIPRRTTLVRKVVAGPRPGYTREQMDEITRQRNWPRVVPEQPAEEVIPLEGGAPDYTGYGGGGGGYEDYVPYDYGGGGWGGGGGGGGWGGEQEMRPWFYGLSQWRF